MPRWPACSIPVVAMAVRRGLRPWSATWAAADCYWPGVSPVRCSRSSASGIGQVIDAAMCEGAALLAHGLFNLEALGEWQGQCAIDSSALFYDVYECADGLWISVLPARTPVLPDLRRAPVWPLIRHSPAADATAGPA